MEIAFQPCMFHCADYFYFSMNSCDSIDLKNDRNVKELKNRDSNQYQYVVENSVEKDIPNIYSSSKGRYHYTLTISNAHREWETYERQKMINLRQIEKLKLTAPMSIENS